MNIKLCYSLMLLNIVSPIQASEENNFTIETKFTLLDKVKLEKVIEESDNVIEKLIAEKIKIQNDYINNGIPNSEINNLLVNFLAEKLEGTKYAHSNATGEWNGTANSILNQSCQDNNTCIQQTPIYRTDKLDCYTFVNLILALLKSNNISEFKKNIVKISYGAYNSKLEKDDHERLLQKIHYVNRNHFTIPDWTNINQANGFITNFSNSFYGIEQSEITSELNRNEWFLFNLDNSEKREDILAAKIKVFSNNLGIKALNFFDKQNHNDSIYSVLAKNPGFTSEFVRTNYFSVTDSLHLLNVDPEYLQTNLPLPAVVGIVRDPVKWNIKNFIGTEYNISHMGVIYAKEFEQDEVIYRDMICSPKQGDNPRECKVTDYKCGEGDYLFNRQNKCWVILYANATSAYPDNYYYYAKSDGQYACTMEKPENVSSAITTCNRVMSIPLRAYLEKNQAVPSILGIHLENIL
ncbi:N-acetylmuramoyl-L-alanine amidase-like domain-containing protein [Fluviispira sanaruensis]|uniref:DUF1460 domain-containing protein n=1 Tax=Fluviispira sanaruensis TaxID=2493639 RepID=A0A4P2VLL0_FLUSA|nr:N-acetylmuramoyl-L-alanine amidase-like domain-containing protein [Fluviispira sanaruensis]BBH52680.1 DUF1460 domain-containing protein [Fluviispira sanaruensis]